MGGGTTVKTTTAEPWKEQIPYLTSGFDAAKALYNKGIPEYYPGETLAGFDPAQTAAHQATLGYAMGPRAAAMQQGAEGALGRSLGGYTGFTPRQTYDLMAGNVRTGAGTPYSAMENALTQGVMGNLKGNILPGLRDQLMRTGQQGGSSRNDLVQNKAIASAVQAGLTKPLAQMYTDAYQTAQGMRLPTAQMGIGQQQFGQQQYPTTMAAPLSLYGAMGDVGQQRRAMSQEAMNRDMARYQYQATAPQQALANYMSMITGNYGGTTTQTSPKDNSAMLGMLGKIGGALIMSDIRTKRDIKPVGKYKGMGVYDYKYKDSPKQYRGLMAQEVEQHMPEAVVNIGGVKHIDYGKV